MILAANALNILNEKRGIWKTKHSQILEQLIMDASNNGLHYIDYSLTENRQWAVHLSEFIRSFGYSVKVSDNEDNTLLQINWSNPS